MAQKIIVIAEVDVHMKGKKFMIRKDSPISLLQDYLKAIGGPSKASGVLKVVEDSAAEKASKD